MITPATARPSMIELYGWDWGDQGVRIRGIKMFDCNNQMILEVMGHRNCRQIKQTIKLDSDETIIGF